LKRWRSSHVRPDTPDPTDNSPDFQGHDSDTPLALSDPRLPAQVRTIAESFGADLAYIGRIDTDQGIEWWLMSHDSELLEAVWFE
jgi:hypothetical protein